jgi:hypothetical protein
LRIGQSRRTFIGACKPEGLPNESQESTAKHNPRLNPLRQQISPKKVE